MKKLITVERLKKIYKEKKYIWNDKFVIVGIRTNDQTPNKFNDWICCISNNVIVGIWECTTEPGLYYLNNPTRLDGTAILVPGQHVDCWVIGLHKGYTALTQCRSLPTWRDNNKDSIVNDSGRIFTDVQGLNIHKGHDTWLSKALRVVQINIGKYSAGCQVFAFKDHFDKFIEYCKLSRRTYFTYTLLEENDFNI